MKLRKYEIDYNFKLWPLGNGELVITIGNPDGDLEFVSIELAIPSFMSMSEHPANHHALTIYTRENPHDFTGGDIEMRATGLVQEGLTIDIQYATIYCADVFGNGVVRSKRRTNTTVSNNTIDIIKA